MGKLIYSAELCTGCRSCELACSFKHDNCFSPHLSRIRIVRVDEEGLDIPTGCEQCEVAACIAVCPTRAIYRYPASGGVFIDYDKCIGCKECMTACPFGAIHYNPDTGKFFKCDLCGGEPECVKWCVTGGVKYLEDDMDGLQRIKRTRTAERAIKSASDSQATIGKGGA